MILQAHELYDFYAELGQALYFAQVLEESLQQIAIIKVHAEPSGLTAEKANALQEQYRGHTLGKLIRICRENSIFGEDILIRLDDFNAERRWLVHRMRADIALSFRNDPQLRLHTVSRIAEMAHKGSVLNADITRWLLADQAERADSKAFASAMRENLRKAGFI